MFHFLQSAPRDLEFLGRGLAGLLHKLVQKDDDFYDAELKTFITTDWQKASKLIHQFLSKAKNTTGDAYLLWRLKAMIAGGSLDTQGEPKKMKDFEIKLKSAALQPTE